MRVVHICNLPLPPNHPDYARISRHPGRWALDLACSQMRFTDHEVQCLVVVPKASEAFVTEIDGVRVHFMPTTRHLWRALTLMVPEAFRMARYVNQHIRPDVVHAHGTEDSNLLIAQRTGHPYVVTVQGLYFIIASKIKIPLVSWPTIVRFTEHFSLRMARFCIAKSDYVATKMKKRYRKMEIFNIPNTYDDKLFKNRPDRKSHRLVFVGTVESRKGLDLIAEALPQVHSVYPDLSFSVVGNSSCPSQYEKDQLEKFKKILGDAALFKGVLSHEDTIQEIAAAEVLVAPSREEMFGNQLIEAVLSGTCPVVMEGTALAENVRRFGWGEIAELEDPKDLAEKIITAFENLDAQEAEVAAKNIREWMGPKRVAEKHIELYEKVIRES
ncbi:MAG: glycosyltransferase [Kiritimatiellales bacterium]